MIASDVPLQLGEGEEFLLTAATFHWIALLFQLSPVVRRVFHQLILGLATPPELLAVAEPDLDLFLVHIEQVHFHVGKGGSDGLAAAALNLQLGPILVILILRNFCSVGSGGQNKKRD